MIIHHESSLLAMMMSSKRILHFLLSWLLLFPLLTQPPRCYASSNLPQLQVLQKQRELQSTSSSVPKATARNLEEDGAATTSSLFDCGNAEEMPFTTYIQIQLSSRVVPDPTTSTTTNRSTAYNDIINKTTIVQLAQQIAEDDTFVDSFIKTYNDFNYNYTPALCTSEGGGTGTSISAARILPPCPNGGGDEIILEVDATCSGCKKDTKNSLRIFSKKEEDSPITADSNGTSTSSNVSLPCFCDPPPTESFFSFFQQVLLDQQQQQQASIPPSSPSDATILNSSLPSIYLVNITGLVETEELVVDTIDSLCGPEEAVPPPDRDSREITIVLYFDNTTTTTTNASNNTTKWSNSSSLSSQLLLSLLEAYVVKAYDASNRLREDLCDPWNRTIEFVNAQIIQDLEDIVYPVISGGGSRGVKDEEDEDRDTIVGIVVQATLSHSFGSRIDGLPVSLNAFEVVDLFTSTDGVNDNITSTNRPEEEGEGVVSSPTRSCLASDANETYFVRGPTQEEFQLELALILMMRDDMDLVGDGMDDEVVWHDVSAQEVSEVPCATGSLDDDDESPTTIIAEVVLVDYIVNCSLVDNDVAVLADRLMEVYNRLRQENYCDPYFRQISSAKALRRGESRLEENNTLVLTVEIELIGTCIGCDPDVDGFYYVPPVRSTTSNNVIPNINQAIDSEVNSIETNSTDTNNSSDLMNTTQSINNTNATDMDNNTTRPKRRLQGTSPRSDTRHDSVCYCPIGAVAARAPSEAEVMDGFRILVQDFQSTLGCVSSVGECRFGTRFEASILVAFNELDSSSNFTTDIEVVLKDTLNTLFFIPRPGICQSDFRLVQSVSATLAIGLVDEDFRRHLGGTQRRAQGDMSEEPDAMGSSPGPSMISSSSSKPSPVPTSNLQDDLYEEVGMVGPSLAPSISTAPSTTSTTASFPGFTSLPSAQPSLAPTASPTSVYSNSVLVLMRISGVCNGCSNNLLLEDEVSAGVSRLSEEEDPHHPVSRFLQTTGDTPESNCFCPIESLVEENGPSVRRVHDVYQDQLEDLDIPLDVRAIQEVKVVDCQGEIEDFETQLIIRFSLNPEEVTNRGLVQLADIIQEAYNELTDEEYCDPLIRRVEDLEFVSMERLEVGQNGCDLVALTFDIIGRCRGCEDASPLFDEPGEDDNARRLMGQDDKGVMTPANNVGLEVPVSRRRLEGSEICLCERNTRADRAPSVEEFEDYLGPNIVRRNIESVCGLSDQFEEIQITDTPSSLPSGIPSESPSACSISLENEFVTEIVFFIEDGATVDTEVADRLGQALEIAYNEMINNQYAECEPLYRVVMSVTPVDDAQERRKRQLLRHSMSEKGEQYKGESSKQDHFTKKYTPPSSRHTSRMLQEDESGVPFRYTIKGQCATCSSDSNIFDVLTTQEVLPRVRDLASPYIDRGQLLDMTETDEIACSNVIVNFDEIIIVELVPSCAGEENFGFNQGVRDVIEETFVVTYNRLATFYCDKFFRTLVDAKVENVGTITDEGNVPVEIRAYAQCRGCNPDEVGIYGNPSSLRSDEAGVVDGNFSRVLQAVGGGRLLQDIDSCVCTAQALANRSPSESELINAFRRSIESSPLDCVASVGECQFGSTFDTDIVISFEGNQTTLTDEVQRTIQESFQVLLNDLYEPDEGVCDPSFRVILGVEVVFNFTLNGEFIESGASLTVEEDSSGRYLTRPDQQHQSKQGSASIPTRLDASKSPSPGLTTVLEVTPDQTPSTKMMTMSPSPAPTTVFDANPNETPTPGPSMSSYPTSSPTSVFGTNFIRTILTVSGICNGCLNELFLSNQVSSVSNRRGLNHRHKQTYLGDNYADVEYLLGRQLQEDGQTPNSNCFCPLTAIVNILPPSSEEVQGGLNRRLEEENIDLIVRDIGTVSAIDCDAEEETAIFESEFTFSFSALSTVSDQDTTRLGAIIELVYNDLVEDYCDPLIRREVKLQLTDRRRVIKTGSLTSGRRDLQGQDIDSTLGPGAPCVNFEATFKVGGSCRGCEDGTPLLDNQNRGLGLSSKVHDRLLSSERQYSERRMRRRHLMDDEEECFCDSSTIAPRAPNVAELWLRLQPELESLDSICGQPVECDPSAFVSELTETTILALLLEPGTVISEVEILELETTYMLAYNDLQTRLRVDKCGGRFRQLTSIEVDRSMLRGTTGMNGSGRRLEVHSSVQRVTSQCTRRCEPMDDADILLAMVDSIKSMSFVREVLAVNELLTGAPSSSPSFQPSTVPSVSPSVSPSTSPSTTPSTAPSESPSTSPSSSPSQLPSSFPSEFPSEYPSGFPSGSPSTLPSISPSTSPSDSPSAGPSTSPSVFPSFSPSARPSLLPSFWPSSEPSQVPSASPSKVVCSSLLCNELKGDLPAPVSCTASPGCFCSSSTCPNCIGTNACFDTVGPVGDNSCLGQNACSPSTGAIGDNSCTGDAACQDLTSQVGNNSCNDFFACAGLSDISIPDNACNVGVICAGCHRPISPGQCSDPSDFLSCPCLPTFGAGSCVDSRGHSACYADGAIGGSPSIIGERSCTAIGSCISLNSANIGNDSCLGLISCINLDRTSIGDRSCNDDLACQNVEAVTTIREDSCNAAFACDGYAGNSIGANACNAGSICRNCTFDVPAGQCNGGPEDCPCTP